MCQRLKERVEAFLKREGIKKDDRVQVAFSGGADSLCLVSLLSSLGQNTLAIYINHNLRSQEELEKEIELNVANCRTLNVPLKIITLEKGSVESYGREHGLSLEAAARALRYQALDEYPLVFTAHNKDDQVESVMMKLLWGGTLLSLGGIRERRGKYLRPLLETSRAEIEEYIKEQNLTASQDSTNNELFCNRNRVRHLVKDTLSDEVKERLCRIAKNIQALEDGCAKVPLSIKNNIYITLSRSAFLSSSPLAKTLLLNHLFDYFNTGRVSGDEKERIILSIEKKQALDSRLFHLRFKEDEARVYPPKLIFSKRAEENMTLPYGLVLTQTSDSRALRLNIDNSIIRLSEEGDEFEGTSLSSLLSAWHIPYAFVLQKREGLAGVFAYVLGGHNRLSDAEKEAGWRLKAGYDLREATIS